MPTPIALARSVSHQCVERVAHALHDPGDRASLAALRDAALGHHQLQHLGAAEEPDDDRHDVDAFPQIQLAEREALDAALRIEADHRQQESERRHDEALDQVPPGERHDEAQAEHRQHQELGRAEREHDRTDHRHRHGQHRGADQRADQRAEQHRAERAPGLAAARHRIAVEHRRGRRRLAGNAEQHRGDVAGRRRHRVHPEQERERRDRVHRVHERQHHRERRGAAQPGQDADDEADRDADQHDAEGVRRQHLQQRGEEDVHWDISPCLSIGVDRRFRPRSLVHRRRRDRRSRAAGSADRRRDPSTWRRSRARAPGSPAPRGGTCRSSRTGGTRRSARACCTAPPDSSSSGSTLLPHDLRMISMSSAGSQRVLTAHITSSRFIGSTSSSTTMTKRFM